MKEQGSILLSSLFVMMLLLCLGGVLTRLMMTELEISQRFTDGIAAFYAAEAGVKRALVEVDKQTVKNNFTESLDNVSYYVTIESGSSKQKKILTASGQRNGAVRKAMAYVLVPDPLPFACFAGTTMILRAKVIGRVGLRGADIVIKDGGNIVDLAGNAAQAETDNHIFKIPTVKSSFAENKYKHAQRLPNVIRGETYNLKGTYYVDGDFELQDAVIAASGYSSATIFVKGSAELAGSIGSNITIISTEMVSIKAVGGNSQRVLRVYANKGLFVSQPLEGQALLMSNGDIRVSGKVHGVVSAQGNVFIDSSVEGSVLADKMIVQSGGGEVKYDEHIFDGLGLNRPQVIAWDF
ncbi:MAG: polymer-forming cytoskeletal protein [Pelosinus sp.]|nr:polymer-forming cytoskeletal protein [Pelosinus sp.]